MRVFDCDLRVTWYDSDALLVGGVGVLDGNGLGLKMVRGDAGWCKPRAMPTQMLEVSEDDLLSKLQAYLVST